MNAVLISIKPKWCKLIAECKKTIEVRKTRPKIDVPFKCYIYCTQEKYKVDALRILPNGRVEGWQIERANILGEYCNGKVIGEFVCDKIDEIGYSPEMHGQYISNIENLHEVSCVNFEEMFDYIADGFGFGWHITNLVIYDKPKEVRDFYHINLDYTNITRIRKAPQSWMYCLDS